MTIINSLPFTLVNGQTADATQVMADFNQIVANANSNAAHNGANSDITSLSALSTPLSVPQGGSGQVTLAAHALLVGAGTAGVLTLAPSTAGHLAMSDGTDWTSTATLTGSYTFTADQKIQHSGTNTLTLDSTSVGGFGNIVVSSPDSTAVSTPFALISMGPTNSTHGATAGEILFQTTNTSNVNTIRSTINLGLLMAGATGGDPGAGKINATDVQINGLSVQTGRTAQVVNSETGALATGTTNMSFADTIPANTAGDQYLSLAITPKFTSSTLIIDVVLFLSNDTGRALGAALFQDSTVNALAAASVTTGNVGDPFQIVFRHKMAAGTTSATTFKVRAGSTAGTTSFNGASGGRLYGGVMASSITITEFLP